MTLYQKVDPVLGLREGAKLLVYQYRFVRPSACTALGTVNIPSGGDEYHRWKQYYWNLRQLCALELVESGLSLTEHREILKRVEAFQWTPERTRLVREPIGSKG